MRISVFGVRVEAFSAQIQHNKDVRGFAHKCSSPVSALRFAAGNDNNGGTQELSAIKYRVGPLDLTFCTICLELALMFHRLFGRSDAKHGSDR